MAGIRETHVISECSITDQSAVSSMLEFILALWDLPFYEYAGEFSRFVAATVLDDATINTMFWLGANYHRPVDLLDTTGLSWREGVFKCLGSVWVQARTSPPSVLPTVRQSSLSAVHQSSLLTVHLSSSPDAANPSDAQRRGSGRDEGQDQGHGGCTAMASWIVWSVMVPRTVCSALRGF